VSRPLGRDFGGHASTPNSVTVLTRATSAGQRPANRCGSAIGLPIPDIGYRFFQIGNGTSIALASNVPGPPVGSEVVGSAFRASELFFAFRIYEPFRNWR
jgi:hypothetical protein